MICCVLLTGRHSVVYGFTLFNKSQSCPPTNISNLKEQHKHLINRPIIGSSSTTDTQKFFSFFFRSYSSLQDMKDSSMHYFCVAPASFNLWRFIQSYIFCNLWIRDSCLENTQDTTATAKKRITAHECFGKILWMFIAFLYFAMTLGHRNCCKSKLTAAAGLHKASTVSF